MINPLRSEREAFRLLVYVLAVAAFVIAVALIATGFGYDPAIRTAQAETVARVLPRVRDIRRGGAAALDLAWLAAGRLDGYYERGLNPWDWAAGKLLVTEAGGAVASANV